MPCRTLLTTYVFFVMELSPVLGAFNFTEDFATGGQPDLNDWDTADITDGQTWIMNAESDIFANPPAKAAKRDSSFAGVGNGNVGRLRVLTAATEPMQAAIDFTFHLDSGSFAILGVLDGTGNTPFRARLLDSAGVVAMEFVSADATIGLLRLSQVNAGQFVNDSDLINWRGGVGANIEIDFDTSTDTFTALITETRGSDQVVLGATAFDNPVSEIARLEIIADVQPTEVGGDLNIERIVLTGEGNLVGKEPGMILTEAPRTAVTIEVPLTDPDLIYRLDSTADVTDPGSWTSTCTFVRGNGSSIQLQSAAGSDNHQLYRVAPVAISPDPPAVSGAILINKTASIIPGLSDLSAAWGDFNNDGFPDLADGVRIWKNSGGISFSFSYLAPGRAWADYNNDGYLDFYGQDAGVVTARIFLNNAGTGFTEQAVSGLPSVISRGGCWGDWDGDSYADLYLGGYETASISGPYQDVILGNNAGSSFSVDWIESVPRRHGRGVTACDFDEDGDLDLYVSNYRQLPNYLWRNNGSGSFADDATTYGVAGDNPPVAPSLNPYGHTIGSAFGDLDNDGHFDLFVGNFNHHDFRWSDESKFLRNLGPGSGYTFQLMDELDGADWIESYASPTLADYDNDGDLDLYFTTAYVGSKSVLYRNDGNWKFTNVTAESGLGALTYTYQAAWADFDLDGDLDLVTEGDFYENQGNANHWLKVKLDGASRGVNRSAIGAQARIQLGNQVLSRQVEGGTGEHNQNDLVLHFGLGGHTGPVDLEITWPGGATETIENLVVDQLVVVD